MKLLAALVAVAIVSPPAFASDGGKDGSGSITFLGDGSTGVQATAGTYGTQGTLGPGSTEATSSTAAADAAPECAETRAGDGGVDVEFDFAATSIGDCYAFVILRGGLDPREPLPLGPIGPGDLLPTAFDRVRDLAELPQLEFAPSRVGLTGLTSYFWLAEEPPTVSATAAVPGLSVTAEASPVRYIWRFGDGADLVTAGPGRPWTKHKPGTVGHLYEVKGDYDLTVEVVYEARWRINGGPWEPLGYFSNADSEPYRVQELIAVLTRSRR